MEQPRRDIYLQKNINEKSEEKKDDFPSLIDIGDAVLDELCSEDDHSNT